VATHALIDALLGAAALGDIGQHYPDTDERWRGTDSIKLLGDTVRTLGLKGFVPYNADITIAAQRPKLLPHVQQMRHNLAQAMGLTDDRVSVKATTTEELGFEGQGEGISARAVVLIRADG
jgi:2-C-methyl-D-erythritol 2,4-cyclodiphosphate synthase